MAAPNGVATLCYDVSSENGPLVAFLGWCRFGHGSEWSCYATDCRWLEIRVLTVATARGRGVELSLKLIGVLGAVGAGISGVFMKGRVTRLFPVCSKFVPAIPDGSNNGLDQTCAPVC